MLGVVAQRVPAVVTRGDGFQCTDSSKGFPKAAWARAGVQDLVFEPTSVLDRRSPSPSSTLSPSIEGSSESGLQGSLESGAAVGLFREQLLDCTSLLEGGNEEVAILGVDILGVDGEEEDGKAKKATVGTLQSGDNRAYWEQNLVHASVEEAELASIKHGQGPHDLIMAGVVAACMSNVGEAPGFMHFFSSHQEKVAQECPHVGETRAGSLTCSGDGVLEQMMAQSEIIGSDGLLDKMVVKSEVMVADGSLEACVMSCRKRDREENSLGEVVRQRCGYGHGRKISSGDGSLRLEPGEWLSDWNYFYNNAEALVKETPVAADNLEDIFTCKTSLPPCRLGENLPSSANVRHGNLQSASKVQLDLYEAVQAGMLGRWASTVGGSASVSSTGQSTPLASPAAPPRHRCSAAVLSSPLNHLGGSPPPFYQHPFSGSAPVPPLLPFTPDSLHNKCPSRPAAPLLAPYAQGPPPAPLFSSPLQLQEFALPLPSIKHSQQVAQAHLCGYQKPEYGSSKAVECLDPKLWQMRTLENDVSAKVVVPGGPKWRPTKQEPEWQQLATGHVRTPLLSRSFSADTEQPALRQQQHASAELVGWCGWLEELSLVERHFTAALEAVRLSDLSSAQAILARLNHQQQNQNSTKRQQKTPSHRVTSLFTEALAKWVSAGSPSPSLVQQTAKEASSMDLTDKISAYKNFCEVSPISQFAHFTANQVILEAMEGEDCIHLIDFELEFGGQWASFMQEISQRSRGPVELTITTLGSDTLEMRLVKENLLQFAKEMGMKLQIDVLPVLKLEDIKVAMVKKGDKEAVVVNFGFGLSRLVADYSCAEGVLGLLELIKGLNPKVIAVVDSECEFEGTTLLDALQFYECIFDAMEASGKLSWEAREKIEKLVFGPKIRDVVNARCVVAGDGAGLPPWRILMQKAGFSSLPFSNAAESQALWLVKNPLNFGFSFIKQHFTLFLGWRDKTLVSASAWV